MKIKIEHESAKFVGNGSGHEPGKKFWQTGGSIILPFEMEPQELSRWCWAAIAVSMARFYNTGRWRQSDVAGRVLGYDCSGYRENPNLQQQCNQNRTLDEALQVTECFSHWSPGKPAFERIMAELDSGRPLCIRIEWFKGSAHYVVIFGYHGIRRELHIADSRYGVSQHSFDRFPLGYQTGGGVWTENFWTCPGNDT